MVCIWQIYWWFGYHHLDIIENFEDAVDYLSNNLYDFIFLGGKYCSEIAKFLADNTDNSNYASSIIIHTWDLVNAEKAVYLLPQAVCLPFDEQQFSTFDI
jgi:hypothetical protein